jgi:hypothetical protein
MSTSAFTGKLLAGSVLTGLACAALTVAAEAAGFLARQCRMADLQR